MAEVQRVAIWPSSLLEVVERQETPYRLLERNAGYLARVAWWLLIKLKAMQPYMETVRSWEYVPQKQGPLHEAMLDAMENGDLRRIADGDAVFIMGGATFQELAHSPAFGEQMRFYTGPFSVADPYRGRRMFDIPIHVVANMTGMAIVPRVIIEQSR